ncbi:hypothetical protein ACC685_33440 [Rhizobium ruizarguesonis]
MPITNLPTAVRFREVADMTTEEARPLIDPAAELLTLINDDHLTFSIFRTRAKIAADQAEADADRAREIVMADPTDDEAKIDFVAKLHHAEECAAVLVVANQLAGSISAAERSFAAFQRRQQNH